MNKAVISLGAAVGGTIGGVLGGMLDHSGFGIWGIILGAVGGFAGIYAAVKIQQ